MKLISINNPEDKILLENLQGNILKGHGRNHTTHIFVNFTPQKQNEFKHFMSVFVLEATSAYKQLKENELYKSKGKSGDVFQGILFTASGLKFLGQDTKAFESTFQHGMKASKSELKDTSSENWEIGFQNQIDAMILLADDDQEILGEKSNKTIQAIKDFATIQTIEYGHVIRNKNGDGLEHFGYVDGISQPLFLEEDYQNYLDEHGATGKQMNFDPSTDKNTVLIKDPLALDTPDAYGSYFVFRKLEQRVKAFKAAEDEVRIELGLEEENELAGAFLVGRFEDGTPLTISSNEGLQHSGTFNNFNYEQDQAGNKCPYHAHIRATNPRTETHKEHIMARRGITYGHRDVPTSIDLADQQYPENGVGLLFMSYQSNIKNQFEYIQKLANNTDCKNPVLDPIIGQDGNKNESNGPIPNPYDSGKFEPVSFESFVHLKGGEYFYAPSMAFLRKI
jgi:Dyp-type peroxidase family